LARVVCHDIIVSNADNSLLIIKGVKMRPKGAISIEKLILEAYEQKIKFNLWRCFSFGRYEVINEYETPLVSSKGLSSLIFKGVDSAGEAFKARSLNEYISFAMHPRPDGSGVLENRWVLTT